MITMTTPIHNIRWLFTYILQSVEKFDDNQVIQYLVRNDEKSFRIFQDIKRFASEGKDMSVAYIEVLKQDRRERRLRYKKNKARRRKEETDKMFEEKLIDELE